VRFSTNTEVMTEMETRMQVNRRYLPISGVTIDVPGTSSINSSWNRLQHHPYSRDVVRSWESRVQRLNHTPPGHTDSRYGTWHTQLRQVIGRNVIPLTNRQADKHGSKHYRRQPATKVTKTVTVVTLTKAHCTPPDATPRDS